MSSHDQNFKNLILDYPGPALQFFAATEVQDVARARILPVRQEQLKERLGERFRELDTPLLLEWPDGRRAAILFVIEEETEPQRFSIHRLAHYCLDLAELLNISRVVPVVIFLHAGEYSLHLALGGDAQTYLDFRFIACALHQMSAEHYLDSDNIVARLNLPNMRYAPARRLEVYACAQEGLITLETSTEKRLKYMDYIDAYAHLSEAEWVQYREDYLSQSQQQEAIMGLLQYSRQEGWQQGKQEGWLQGLQEGRQEGRQEGEVILMLRLLHRRFGTLAAPVSTKIQALPAAKLEALVEALLDFSGLDDLESWLRNHGD